MNKETFKTSKGFRTVFAKVKPNFTKNRSDVFNVPNVNNAISQANPLESQSIGVHRSQVQEFNEMYRGRWECWCNAQRKRKPCIGKSKSSK